YFTDFFRYRAVPGTSSRPHANSRARDRWRDILSPSRILSDTKTSRVLYTPKHCQSFPFTLQQNLGSWCACASHTTRHHQRGYYDTLHRFSSPLPCRHPSKRKTHRRNLDHHKFPPHSNHSL
ncbi:unnamed protein product, partial [Ectocarpus sp. 6 AP-2014]